MRERQRGTAGDQPRSPGVRGARESYISPKSHRPPASNDVSARTAADCPYVSERTKTWLKVKCRQRQEFVIGGWKKSEHGGVRSIMVGYYHRG